jgi:putative ABC transport system permease protein
MFVYFQRNIKLALDGIYQNKLRAFLTALGIIFGVFAVVAMLAIGNGAKKSILDQLKIIGTNNIVINSIPPDPSGEANEEDRSKEEKKSYSPGLTLLDVASIKSLVPEIENISFESGSDAKILYEKNTIKAKCQAVNNDFFVINNLELYDGSYFTKHHETNGSRVCILGSNAASRLFLGKNPIGKSVKSNNVIFTVIGVLKKRLISKEALVKLDINNYSNNIFVPMETYKMRIDNKIRIGREDVKTNNDDESDIQNYHQLDKIIVKVKDAAKMETSAALISRLLLRRHNNQADFEIKVPELLIKQQQNTQEKR